MQTMHRTSLRKGVGKNVTLASYCIKINDNGIPLCLKMSDDSMISLSIKMSDNGEMRTRKVKNKAEVQMEN